jgi:hypothetical protein
VLKDINIKEFLEKSFSVQKKVIQCNIQGEIGSKTTYVAACSSSPSVPCPSDQELIDRFVSNETEFEKLAKDSENQGLLSALSIDCAVERSSGPKQIWFQVWFRDFAGPGGCSKGYAYCEVTPSSLVDSIDSNSDPGSPEIKEIYRHIKGNWYLFYHSDN